MGIKTYTIKMSIPLSVLLIQYKAYNSTMITIQSNNLFAKWAVHLNRYFPKTANKNMKGIQHYYNLER